MTWAGRAWVRGAVRRPGRGAVIIAALAIMTLATIASLVAADSLDALFVADARAEWGEVDVEVTATDSAVMELSMARLVAVDALVERASAAAPRVVFPAVVRSGEHQEPDALVLGLGPEEQTFGSLEAIEGTADVLRLSPDQTIVNERLMGKLGLGVGDEIRLVIGVPEIRIHVTGSDTPLITPAFAARLTLTVAGVSADSGVADLHRTPNVMVRQDVLQRVARIESYVTQLHLRSRAPGKQGAKDLINALATYQGLGLAFEPVKQDALDRAEDEGGQFRSILLTLAFLTIGAAIVATIHLLTALGRERMRELGLLRTMGVSDRRARRFVIAEALTYTGAGLVVGGVSGVFVARWLAGALADHFASINLGRGREQVALDLAVDPVTLLVGVIIVLLAAVWAGNDGARTLLATPLDDVLRGSAPARAPGPTSARRPAYIAAFGAYLLGAGTTADVAADAFRYAGLTALLGAWWMHRRRRSQNRARLDARAGVLALAWATLGAGALADFSQGYEVGFGVLVVAGVVSIGAATVLLVPRMRRIVRTLRAYLPLGRPQAALRTGAAYAEEWQARSGATMALLGIVLFMVAALNVLGNATDIDVARQGGGFDVLATSVAPLPEVPRPAEAAAVVAMNAGTVPETSFWVEDDDGNRFDVRYPVRLIGLRPDFIASQRFGVADALPAYRTATELLEAAALPGTSGVLGGGISVSGDDVVGSGKIVLDRYARPEGSRLGDDVVLDLGAGPKRFELIGVLDTFLFGGVFLSDDELRHVVPTHGPTFLAATSTGAPDELADALEHAGARAGLDARPMGEIADRVVAVNRTFTDVFGYTLLFALAVALVAVGALMVRAARERRTSLAVVRALGFRTSTVRTTLLTESLVGASVGGIAGAAVGLAVLRLLFAAGFSDLAFVVNWGRLGLVALGVEVLLLIVCLAAARAASRIEIEPALRDLG